MSERPDEWERSVRVGVSIGEGLRHGDAVMVLARLKVARKELAAEGARASAAEAARDELAAQLNAPELHDFARGVRLEAAHQRARWGSEHDAGKTPADWFWLVGYLAGKALHAAIGGDRDKALHHTISTAAALANWHAAMLGQTDMRPGLSGDVAAGIDGNAARDAPAGRPGVVPYERDRLG